MKLRFGSIEALPRFNWLRRFNMADASSIFRVLNKRVIVVWSLQK